MIDAKLYDQSSVFFIAGAKYLMQRSKYTND